jgi:FixJ family two-component response regulator
MERAEARGGERSGDDVMREDGPEPDKGQAIDDGGNTPAVDGTVVALVEDNAPMREALDNLLRAHGYTVRPFASAEAFLASWETDRQTEGRKGDERSGSVACLLLDLCLPGRNGLELLRYLNGIGSTLPVVFLSGYGCVASIRDAALAAGAVAFLDKAGPMSDLLAAIARAISTGVPAVSP